MANFDIRSLPKISLHDHLDGGLRPQTIIELAAEIGYELPADNAKDLKRWFEKSADSGNLVDYLKTFDVTTAVMQTREGLTRVAREFVLDLANDGAMRGQSDFCMRRMHKRQRRACDENGARRNDH